ncbi:16S rRNA (guanine(966)-N(2))-methyltransferase RsmD [Candidatus Dojkabacteria bacterium CG_4_9_14_3_um_filter_150_Dojkabacteria_WS6_41_13]|nr:MAG: 16S rRNA (guanine(966)-N(2))-methyltransferase RsmD [Candidatus Dojkabacteria bacterium CG_4_10_14_3_um_filter_Dojkabacteria_WS6_41_9]PJB22813.1 MAG: 16S rRNA (guanine(966)-N(2))-methyltransferase RsmD [Candidatus Dojkabacteria bacterium CG_4_9_14_3_um_filter_150_Dojkabacteria_WS6_41_13]
MAYIAAGRLKHAKLLVPHGDVRPTQRILRLSIFDFLADFVTNANVLDLFAGTGAFGIEAISRGANKVIFVDISSKATEIIKMNLIAIGIRDRCVVYQEDAIDFLVKSIRKNRTFDIVFVDPPFTKLRAMRPDEYTDFMLEITDRAKRLLKPQSIIIVKYPKKMSLPLPTGLTLVEQRDYGLNRVAFLAQTEYIIQEDTAHDPRINTA